MCVSYEGKTERTKKKLIFYKRVNRLKRGVYVSGVPVNQRSRQPGARRCGVDFTYRIGVKVTSPMPKTPGFYCFTTYKEAWDYEHVIISVRVPKGTKIRYALGNKACVESLIPVRSVRNPDAS